MKKIKKFKLAFEQVKLRPQENQVFKTLIKQLLLDSWDTDTESIYQDEDWGWILLATKHFKEYGEVLRRIKPVEITKLHTLEAAKNLQKKLRRDLVEVWPYEIVFPDGHNTKIQFLEPLWTLS